MVTFFVIVAAAAHDDDLLLAFLAVAEVHDMASESASDHSESRVS